MKESIDWHTLDKKEVFKKLNSDEQGLSDDEAFNRLEKYGRNEIRQIFQVNPLKIFLQQFGSFFIIILLFAALFSLFIKHYIDFSVILAIILINSFIGFFQQYKAEKTIKEMKELLVPKVKVIRQGILSEILSHELVPGDIMLISEGDKIMADCRIFHNNDLETNEAVLTGESFPQIKSSEKLSVNTELADRENMLYMGTSVARGNGKAIVVSTGMDTEFGKIARLVQHSEFERTPLEKKLDDFSKKVGIIVIVLAVIIIAIGLFRGENKYDMLLAGVALAISVIPEGIPAVIAITLAFAIKRMHNNHVLIRKLPAAETLGRTTVICVDKTGTLTEEKMTVTELYCNDKFFRIQGINFYDNKARINPKNIKEIELLLKTGIMCNNAHIEKENNKIIGIIGDPTEQALIISADKAGYFKKQETEKETRLKEYSFSSKRKLMSIVRKNKELISYVKGAPDVLLKKCAKELVNGRIINLTEKRKLDITKNYDKMASDALRVLGFAFKPIPEKFNQDICENDLIFIGFQGMIDPPRQEIKSSIKECLNSGIKIKMLTGDSILTAKAVSEMIALKGNSIEGKDIEKLSGKEFDIAVRENNIFARITPEIKLKIIISLKKQGEIVAVTGDGINDVLALKEAHLGIAMGIRGTDVTREVADMILLDDNFSSIIKAVKEGRRVYDNMKKSIKFHLAANIDELLVVLLALILAFPLPLMPLAILWMNLITDSLPSLALSVEKADSDIMTRKPRNPKEDILSGIIGFILLAGIISAACTIVLFMLYYKQDLDKARTIALSVSVFCELFLIWTCRTDKNIWKIGIFSNKPLIYSVAIAFLLQILAIFYLPLAKIFGFKPLSITELLIVIAVSLLPLIIFESYKFIRNKRHKNKK